MARTNIVNTTGLAVSGGTLAVDAGATLNVNGNVSVATPLVLSGTMTVSNPTATIAMNVLQVTGGSFSLGSGQTMTVTGGDPTWAMPTTYGLGVAAGGTFNMAGGSLVVNTNNPGEFTVGNSTIGGNGTGPAVLNLSGGTVATSSTASPAICRSAMSASSARAPTASRCSSCTCTSPPLARCSAPASLRFALGLLLTPLLRLSGAYFSIANLAAALAVMQFISNPNLEPITRGPYGVSLSGIFNPKLAYGLAVAVMAASLLVVVWLRNSRFGLALQAVREDAVSARARASTSCARA